MRSVRFLLLVSFSVVAFGACGGGEADADDERDLNLPPAESIATLGDTALGDADEQAVEQVAQQAAEPPDEPPPPPPRREPPPAVDEGTTIMLSASDSIELNDDMVGQNIFATVVEGLYDTRGREVIPAGAVFQGVLEKTEVTDSNGTTEVMLLTFQQVSFLGTNYPLQARTDSVGVRTASGGMGLDEAAKIGAGAAVGAIAGRLIGGNRTGTLVGAAVGTAAGVGIAMATRGEKVLLDAGAAIRITLTEPFTRTS
jgi:hypothetical protein